MPVSSLRHAYRALVQHLETRHPEHKTKCLICGAKYSNSNNLKQHLLYRHAVTDSDDEALIKCMQLLALSDRHKSNLLQPACQEVIRRKMELENPDEPAAGPPPR